MNKMVRLLIVGIAVCSSPVSAQLYVAEVPGFEPGEMSPQETPVWCWSASIQAILRHHDIAVSQAEIVQATYGVVGPLPAANPNVYVRALNGMRIRGDVVEVVSASLAGTFISSPQLAAELESGNPVLVWYSTGPMSAHVVVLYRAEFYPNGVPATFTYWDPYPGVGVRTVNAQQFNQVAQAFNLIRGVRIATSGQSEGQSVGGSLRSSETGYEDFADAVRILAAAAEEGEIAFDELREFRPDSRYHDGVSVNMPGSNCVISKNRSSMILCDFETETSRSGAIESFERLRDWLQDVLPDEGWRGEEDESAEESLRSWQFTKLGTAARVTVSADRDTPAYTYSTYLIFRAAR